MNTANPQPDGNNPTEEKLRQLEVHLKGELNGRIRDAKLLARHGGLVITGFARSFHTKQLAQQILMRTTDLPIVANEIEVHNRR
jgi:hypothetical protein